MSSSVSSECTFSHGGITIHKRRSCLKGDIVEALQCVKCAIRDDLLFREAVPSSTLEAKLEAGDDLQGDEDEVEESNEEGWDLLLIEDEDEA